MFYIKHVLSVILLIAMILTLCGCGGFDTSSTHFSQEVTIVKMPAPPMSKTTDSISVVNDVIDVLGLIEKSPIQSNDKINGGYEIIVKLKIDGKELIYTVGNVFTDSDGKQYNVTNFEDIKDKFNKIYDQIEGDEVEYR